MNSSDQALKKTIGLLQDLYGKWLGLVMVLTLSFVPIFG